MVYLSSCNVGWMMNRCGSCSSGSNSLRSDNLLLIISSRNAIITHSLSRIERNNESLTRGAGFSQIDLMLTHLAAPRPTRIVARRHRFRAAVRVEAAIALVTDE